MPQKHNFTRFVTASKVLLDNDYLRIQDENRDLHRKVDRYDAEVIYTNVKKFFEVVKNTRETISSIMHDIMLDEDEIGEMEVIRGFTDYQCSMLKEVLHDELGIITRGEIPLWVNRIVDQLVHDASCIVHAIFAFNLDIHNLEPHDVCHLLIGYFCKRIFSHKNWHSTVFFDVIKFRCKVCGKDNAWFGCLCQLSDSSCDSDDSMSGLDGNCSE